MAEINEDIIGKNIIKLSRNTPVALVVGAAGFLGSHLTEALLEKNIQVVGIDNFKTGKKENLEKATKLKNFHFLNQSAQDLDLGLVRLDYVFIVASSGWEIKKILDVFKNKEAKLLFISSIELYGQDLSANLAWFKENESKIAKFAQDNKLNARILRLGAVFGPRMDFKIKDPIVKLIYAALTEDLQKEMALDFSSRALYVDDAVNLIVKCMLAGATAMKLFDGVLPTPIKVLEIKQVLLDPVWYEQRGFNKSELPPWITPNLEKTEKFLSWQPQVGLVTSLKKTLSYFKDNEIKIDKDEEVSDQEIEWKEEKRQHLEAIKPTPASKEKRIKLAKSPISLSGIYFLIVLAFIFYALIWPLVLLGWGVFTFKYQLTQAATNLSKGDFEQSLKNVSQAEWGINEAQSILQSIEVVKKTNIFNDQFEVGEKLINLGKLSANASRSTVLGTQSLYQGLKAVSGELNESADGYFKAAQIDLAKADENLAIAQTLIQDPDFLKQIPQIIRSKVASLGEKLVIYNRLVSKARASAILLPEIVALEGNLSAGQAGKSYLVLLQNNNELRPGGGFIGSFAKISFEGGKLKKIDVNDIYAIDGQLKQHVEPPKEIKEDLGQKDWFLRDSNWEPDFPTNARQAEWFYTKETGETVAGVVALDVSAMESLLGVVGSLNLSDYNETITADNLFEKAIAHAEQGFFPGSQSKKSFITALTNELFNKIFFLPKQNWPGIVTALGNSLEEKHMSIYLNDPKLFSYLVSQRWTNALPRTSDDKNGPLLDLLVPVEANLGANKVNYYLERHYSLETTIGKDGEVKHRLRITYLNRSPSDTWPAGKYKNRFRIYLPFGTKLTKALWGETDLTKDVSSFVDYGRSGYSLLLELQPKEQKVLVLDYQNPYKLEFKNEIAKYRLDVLKQAGVLKDPFEWRLTYPINYQLVSQNSKNLSPQEELIQTDLSKDRSFVVEFKK